MSTYDDRPGDTRAQRYGYRDTGYDGLMDNHSETAVIDRERTFDEPAAAPPWRLRWNSGADLGLLILRLAAGCIFAAHGAQKVFGWWGGPGLDEFANNLTDLGFTQTDVLSAATGFTELVGGVLLLLGLFTPLAGAGLVAVAINAAWVKLGNGLFLADGGYEAELALGAIAAGLTMIGAGRISLDNGRFWFRHPVATGWLFLLLGVGAGIAARILFSITL